MNFDQFKKRTGSGGEALAREAWDKVVALVKAGLPKDQHAKVDRALLHDPALEEAEDAPAPKRVVRKRAGDSAKAKEK